MNCPLFALAMLANVWTHVPSEEAWAPSAETIKTVQASLKPAVRKAAKQFHLDLPKWSEYEFRFQGRIVGGKRVVFVSASCANFDDQPKDQFLYVSDGGTCFFETTFDPETKSFSGISFHGVA
jgi:hypothetical protein